MINDSPFHREAAPRKISRRDFLWQSGGGLGGLALTAMLGQDRALAGELPVGGRLHHPAKAKRVVQFFMAGAASHIDLFDFKPELIRRHGQPSDFGEPVEAFQNGLGPWLRPLWDFNPYGQSGKMLSDAVAPLGAVVDDLAFVHNLVGKSGVHSAATLLQTTGFLLPGFPGAGCWASYGLGSLNENLPTFVVLPDHRGFPSNGVKNWDAAFLPSQHSFQRRLAAICAATNVTPPANLHSFNLRGKTATMTMLAVELPRLIKLLGAGLVILDPWYKISAQSGADENNNKDQGHLLAEAERIVTANGAALVLGHHFSKGDAGSKNSIDRAAGAGAMARWGDVIATLSEHEEQDAMTLELHLRDFAPVEKLALRWNLPLWRRDGSLDPANLKKSAGRRDEHPPSKLLGMLTDGMTSKEWSKATRGWSGTTFTRKLKKLVSDKKVTCEMGTYRRA